MNCLDYRRNLETEPGRVTPEMQAHVQTCAECSAWSAGLRAFEARLQRALAVGVPAAKALELPALSTPPARRFALAAGVLGAIGIAALAWFSFPRETLAAELVAHVEEEPQSWSTTEPVPEPTLDEVLRRSQVSAHFPPGSVTYARSCRFRGHLVPHLVVHDEQGSVTVLILDAEKVSAKTSFSEEGMSGVILPAAHGSIAVLSREGAPVDAIAERMREALGS
ncbi:MAG TPA: DUF3379 family protein [Steroidobacteraceae bacterium]|jgi:hypothetical protein